MAEVKRKLSQVSDELGSPHDDKKLHIKPGRKPIDTEPKSKRTAQNRAAQRAYRERKEKRMGELEIKVKFLEDEKIRASTELDFLRAQVDILKKELSLYRGHLDIRDLESKLPLSLGGKRNQFSELKNSQSKDAPEQSNGGSGLSEEFNGKHSSSFSTLRSDLLNNSIENRFFVTSPTDNSQGHSSNSHSEKESFGQKQVPDLVSWSSSSTSPLDNYASPKMQGSNLNDVNYEKQFDEQVDPFCAKLNEACGTKECPIPKDKRSIYGVQDSRNQKQESKNRTGSQQNPFTPENPDLYFHDDPLASFNDDNFDVSLALGDNLFDEGGQKFNGDQDFPSWLVEEQSAYDPLNPNSIFNMDTYVSSQRSPSREEEDSGALKENNFDGEGFESGNSHENNEVVPAPEEHVKCSEIWDRIVSHPKYTELDIDGLCSELKSKAKCCESGVVISSSDVNKLITRSISDKQ